MAKNVLTPEQDLLTRQFYVEIAQVTEALLPNTPAFGRQLRSILLLLLNYDLLPNGVFVTKGTTVTKKLGSEDYSAYPDEWVTDLGRALADVEINKHEANNNTDTSEASTSEPSKNTEVRETVLPKDVS